MSTVTTLSRHGRGRHYIVATLFVPMILLCGSSVSAFWLVNFGPAQTVQVGHWGIVAGTGGQFVSVGDPRTDNAFFFIPHAGIRYGVAQWIDIGYRLAPFPVPFTTQAPPIGGNIDAKFFFGDRAAPWKFATVLGAGMGHVQILNEHRLAYSPNAAFLLTRSLPNGVDVTAMLRYVWIGIPTGPGGTSDNHVGVSGVSLGVKLPITTHVAFLPEVGVYHYAGRLAGERTNGPAGQYGFVLSVGF